MVGDVLTKMVVKPLREGLIKGVMENFRSGGVLALQYTDDTLLFSSYDRSSLRNLKIVLMLFEKISGMRINFNKSEFIPINLENEEIHEISHILKCHVGTLPFKYLVVPIHFEKLKREELQLVVDKLIKRVAAWRGRLLAYSSRLILIKTCLANIPVYLLSFIKFLKWAILIESQMAHCLWNSDSDNHRYHLASSKHVSMNQEFEGLGVPDLRELNLCLLGSWIRRHSQDNEKIWKMLVDFKYNNKNLNIFTCRENGVSNF
jgi:hypothetical protein